GYLTLDQNGVVRECNLTAAAMIGKSKAALTGITLLGLVHADYRPALMRFLKRCKSGGDTQVDEVFLIRTTDKPRYIQFLCRVRGTPATRHELVAAMIDVTERRQLEHERAQLADERAALAKRLLSAQEE